MAKLSFGAYPHMLGFEQLEQLLERTAKSSNEGYPPFNIEQTSDRSFRISLATAGFSEADLSICLLYTSPSPRDVEESRMPSSA